LNRRKFIASAVATVVALPLLRSTSASAAGEVRTILASALSSGRYCGRELAALKGTIARLDRTKQPSSGRSIIVDIPSQTLTAYDATNVAMESVVVVGDPDWRTPDLDTTVAYVRFNPTWTVPKTIVEARNWKSKLARDPGYFSDHDFLVEVHGKMLDPDEAAGDADSATRFVQQPGRGNALGRVKFGLNAGDAIYLHDTNDKSAFDEDSRALSHGCMRVEKALELAGWALGLSGGEVARLVEEGDATERRPSPAIRLATTYFTAWPDGEGNISFYDDVYSMDGKPSGSCKSTHDRKGTFETEQEYAN
jgi:murein L,D-transpeptidase YcbB/YkuD